MKYIRYAVVYVLVVIFELMLKVSENSSRDKMAGVHWGGLQRKPYVDTYCDENSLSILSNVIVERTRQ